MKCLMYTIQARQLWQVDLIDMMQDVTADTKECIYHSNKEFLMAQ